MQQLGKEYFQREVELCVQLRMKRPGTHQDDTLFSPWVWHASGSDPRLEAFHLAPPRNSRKN